MILIVVESLFAFAIIDFTSTPIKNSLFTRKLMK